MSWVESDAWRAVEPDPLLADARRIIHHVNDDHADALRLYAEAFSRLPPSGRTNCTKRARCRRGTDRAIVRRALPKPIGG